MKRTFIVFLFLCISFITYSQILIDDGPIIIQSKNKFSPDFTTQGNSWDHRILTYWFSNGTDDISGNDERTSIRSALDLWQNQTDIRFFEVCDSVNADIIFMWGTGDHGCGTSFDGVGGVLAHGFYPPPNGTFAGDVHFDDAETWTTDTRSNSNQPLDLVTIAAHEIGHSLGLAHSSVTSSLMYAYYSGSHRYLDLDDINGIRSIYGNLGSSNFYSGPRLLCTSPNSTFTLYDQPNGSSISWTKSNILDYISGQGSDTYVAKASSSSGAAWVQATLTTDCDTLTLPLYSVWVGTPVVSVTGPDEGYANVEYAFQAHTADPEHTDPFSYTWDMYPYDGYISTSQGGNYAAYGYFTFYNVYSASGYWVKARAQNDCGTGAYGQTNIWIHDYWKLSPNPASEIATLTRVVSESDNTKMISSDGENTSCDIQILDYYGSLQYQATKSGDSFTIPVNNLKDGTYFVKITQGKQTTNLKLVVKH